VLPRLMAQPPSGSTNPAKGVCLIERVAKKYEPFVCPATRCLCSVVDGATVDRLLDLVRERQQAGLRYGRRSAN
jgi:hypothetical protein